MSILVLALFGCHATFRNHAPDLEQVRVQVVMSGEPYVTLGKLDAGSYGPTSRVPQPENVVEAHAMEAEQTADEIQLAADFARRVTPQPLTEKMTQGLLDTIRSGPPFELTTDPRVEHTLQIEVTSFGLAVPYIGAPGEFTFDVQARLYRGDTGERVYSTSLRCDAGAGDAAASSVALGAVDHVREIDRMSDEELQATFDDIAYYCGTYFATRMRKHAG